jgi:hypothetical protein
MACEHKNELAAFIKRRIFLYQPSNYKLTFLEVSSMIILYPCDITNHELVLSGIDVRRRRRDGHVGQFHVRSADGANLSGTSLRDSVDSR